MTANVDQLLRGGRPDHLILPPLPALAGALAIDVFRTPGLASGPFWRISGIVKVATRIEMFEFPAFVLGVFARHARRRSGARRVQTLDRSRPVCS